MYQQPWPKIQASLLGCTVFVLLTKPLSSNEWSLQCYDSLDLFFESHSFRQLLLGLYFICSSCGPLFFFLCLVSTFVKTTTFSFSNLVLFGCCVRFLCFLLKHIIFCRQNYTVHFHMFHWVFSEINNEFSRGLFTEILKLQILKIQNPTESVPAGILSFPQDGLIKLPYCRADPLAVVDIGSVKVKISLQAGAQFVYCLVLRRMFQVLILYFCQLYLLQPHYIALSSPMSNLYCLLL